MKSKIKRGFTKKGLNDANKWCKQELDKLKGISDPLAKRIKEYENIKDIGEVMTACADYVMRIYMWKKWDNWDQYDMATEILKYLTKLMDKKGHVDSLPYRVIELGELLKCKEMWGSCEYAKDCWVTRRGFCRKNEEKDRRRGNDNL
jgi:hypothetical protein